VLRNGETSRTGGGGFIAAKVVDGGGPKWSLRCGEGAPGGGEAQEGRGPQGALNGARRHRTPAGSKALKPRALKLARVKPQAEAHNGRRA